MKTIAELAEMAKEIPQRCASWPRWREDENLKALAQALGESGFPWLAKALPWGTYWPYLIAGGNEQEIRAGESAAEEMIERYGLE